MNLVSAIHAMNEELDRIQIEYNKQVKEIFNGLEMLRKYNTVCERCSGQKKILRSRACAEDDRPDPNDSQDYITCWACEGTGFAPYVNIKTYDFSKIKQIGEEK